MGVLSAEAEKSRVLNMMEGENQPTKAGLHTCAMAQICGGGEGREGDI